jgi:hypothetical protein
MSRLYRYVPDGWGTAIQGLSAATTFDCRVWNIGCSFCGQRDDLVKTCVVAHPDGEARAYLRRMCGPTCAEKYAVTVEGRVHFVAPK